MATSKYYTVYLRSEGYYSIVDPYGNVHTNASSKKAANAIAKTLNIKRKYSMQKRQSNSGLMSNIRKIIPVDALIQTTDGKIHALRTKNPGRTKNVAMGYMAGGVFHPIRASADYDESRVGESRPGKRKKATKKKAAKRSVTKKPARKAIRTSRATYWGD